MSRILGSEKLAWFVAGMAAAAVAIGVGELLGGVLGGTSIIAAIGTVVISLQPPGGKDLMVALFGTNDKLALEVLVASGGLLVGGLLGLIARRDVRAAIAGFVAFGVVAFWLLSQDPLNMATASILVVVAAVGAGIMTLNWLVGALRRSDGPPARVDTTPARVDTAAANLGRRAFLVVGGTFVAVGGVLAIIGRFLGSQIGGSIPPGTGVIPSPRETVAPVPAAADFSGEAGLERLSPIVVSNADFYRIDTRLSTPRIDAATWNVRVHGMVAREITLTYEQLLAMPLIERYITIACVSNEVGGNLVGNAKWTGVSLKTVLESAGVQSGATQLVGRSFDGWTAGFPTAHLEGAGREALIALLMNGEPLPAQHGFPARLIVPGLFGYVSATKWITEIELTTLEAFDAYWIPLGWAKEGPILTQSRIDVPQFGGSVGAGAFTVAGVAWAPTRGISRVEVRLDDGAWQQAELSQPLSNYAWVQWRLRLDLAAGPHRLTVRATDGTGATQPEVRTAVAPDGARGWHEVNFSAS